MKKCAELGCVSDAGSTRSCLEVSDPGAKEPIVYGGVEEVVLPSSMASDHHERGGRRRGDGEMFGSEPGRPCLHCGSRRKDKDSDRPSRNSLCSSAEIEGEDGKKKRP